METLTLEQASYLAEIIGVVAVVASIIYLAIQVKQNGRSLRVQTVHDLSSQFKEAQSSIAHDKELADIYHRGVFNFDQLDSLEQLRFNLHVASLVRMLDELLFQYKEGALEESQWNGFKTLLEDVFRYPGYQSVWAIRRQQYSKVFQQYLDNVIQNSQPRDVPLYPELGS